MIGDPTRTLDLILWCPSSRRKQFLALKTRRRAMVFVTRLLGLFRVNEATKEHLLTKNLQGDLPRSRIKNAVNHTLSIVTKKMSEWLPMFRISITGRLEDMVRLCSFQTCFPQKTLSLTPYYHYQKLPSSSRKIHHGHKDDRRLRTSRNKSLLPFSRNFVTWLTRKIVLLTSKMEKKCVK